MIAFIQAGIKVDRYVAYEIDKFAIKTSMHNFPIIEHRGNVFDADYTEFEGFDYLIGGSPCTYWSIAQTRNRETEASGMGWELFSQYVRALHEAKPKFFIYENNKSMSKAIRDSITNAFGFEPICINSALVSAQNRQRLYWVGKREKDGTYSKVPVEQPEDRGIVLNDIIDGVSWKAKQNCLDANYFRGGDYSNLKSQSGQRLCVGESVCVAERGRYTDTREIQQQYEARTDGKTNVLTTVQKDNRVAVPVCLNQKSKCMNGESLQPSLQNRIYGTEGKHTAVTCSFRPNVALPLCASEDCVELPPYVLKRMEKAVEKYGYIPDMWNPYNNRKITRKTPTQTAQCSSVTTSPTVLVTESVQSFAVACEWNENGKPTKAISTANGKIHAVYEVKDGQIHIRGKEYKMKLPDGFYIIRKLTVTECKRLQTVPEWFEFPVSDSQAYKMLGNGWTVDVIVHLLSYTIK